MLNYFIFSAYLRKYTNCKKLPRKIIMKIYVSVDLEGIHQIDRFDNRDNKNPDYQLWKKQVSKLMYEEVFALYRGIAQKGVSNVIIFDSHSCGDTLHVSHDLPGLTQVKRSSNNKLFFPSFDSTFDGIVLWGYHVKAGSKNGKLGHTNSRRIKKVKVNEKEVGEVYLHSLYASNWRVPLLAVSGDTGLENEVKKDIGDIPFFNTDLGDKLSREKYLAAIQEFIFNLDVEEVLKLNHALDWPLSTTLTVTYKKSYVNLGRWLLKKQFKHSKLKGLSSCECNRGSFSEQWDQFCGLL